MKITRNTLLLIATLVESAACYGVPDENGATPQALTRTGSGPSPATNTGTSSAGQAARARAPDAGRSFSLAVTSGDQYTRLVTTPNGSCLSLNNSQETITDGDCTYEVLNVSCRWVPVAEGERACQCATIVLSTRGDCREVVVGAD
jgi:hypothetical protein